MAKRVGVDKWLFGTVLLLVLFGLVMVFSASAVMAKATVGSPYAFVLKQAVFVLLGLVAIFILMRVDYRHYNNPKLIFPAMAITGLMLIGVFALLERRLNRLSLPNPSLLFSWRGFCKRACT